MSVETKRESFADFRVRLENDRLLADAARRFVTAELEMSGDFKPDMGTVTACLAAHHDMYVLAGLPCGCDEGTCPGVLG